ncbi:maleate cis-trans isomerase family protein [Aspergillus stella-maris]|uniref:maleate cis-trans isomerase family protein n=1 Tax=Aspergillus stella-maris TaxID=1810926 RepID=UPI003CCC997B
MVGHLADRAQFGLILPSTNTSVEAEFNRMLVPGVSWHSGRIFASNPDLSSSENMVSFLEDLRTQIKTAVQSVCHAKVDYLVMGMSAETFWGGADGADKFVAFMGELSGGLRVTSGAAACKAVIDTYKAKKIAIITPYQPVGDQQVVDFFTEIGVDVVRIHGMKCDSATSIADVSGDEIKDAFRKINGDDVDLLLQAGTNLCAARAAAEMEGELGKPVVAINAATVWHAYRANGIMDQIEGWGELLEKY